MKNYECWLDACNKESRLLGRELYLDNDDTFKRFIEFKMKNIYGHENWRQRTND